MKLLEMKVSIVSPARKSMGGLFTQKLWEGRLLGGLISDYARREKTFDMHFLVI